jgi:hypothetical protein
MQEERVMTKKSSNTKSTKANVQPSPEGGPDPVPGSPVRKTSRLSPELKETADRIIAKREPKKAPMPKREPEEDLVVFAFRLSPEEREVIHKAAGPARASKFVRAVAIAAACKDEAALRLLVQSIGA